MLVAAAEVGHVAGGKEGSWRDASQPGGCKCQILHFSSTSRSSFKLPSPPPLLYLLHLLASFSRSAHALDSVLQLPEVELAAAKFAFRRHAKEGITSGCRFLTYRAPLRPAGMAPKPVGA